MEDLILFIHKLAAISWIGVVIGEGFLAGKGKQSDVEFLEDIIGKMKKLSMAGRGAGALITLTGLALVFMIGYQFTELWIVVKLLVVITTVAIGALFSGKAYQEIANHESDAGVIKTQIGLIARNSYIISVAAALALVAAYTKF